MFRILAIEPDFERGRRLTQLVREHVDAEVVLVASTDAAIAAMSDAAPDLILTSALLAPHDDSVLTAYLKERDGARDLSVLTVPPVVDMERPPQRTRRPSIFRRRGTQPWPAYDPAAVGGRIGEALRESAARGPGRRGLSPVVAASAATAQSDAQSIEAMLSEELLLENCGLGVKRLRAHRWGPADLPWLSSINLPWGLQVQLLNISKSGMLIESGDKFFPGSSMAFHLSGQDKNLVVPARIVRSQVALVNTRGVRYRAAAVFDKDLDLLTQRPQGLERSIVAPKALSTLLDQVMDQLEGGATPASVRAAFEQGLQRMVSARQIRICDVSDLSKNSKDSVYYTVPTNRGFETVLQATFEPNHQPLEEEIRILKAAATLAAFILQFEDVVVPDRTSTEPRGLMVPAAAGALIAL
jgi:hypothetical protein